MKDHGDLMVVQRIPASTRHGFTLVELAIVLGVIGLLLAGLFQLTSASSRQINNQITAQQLQGWSKAVKSYLITKRADPTGTAFYGCNPTCGNATYSVAVNAAVDITLHVRGYKNNGLPRSAPNNADYKAVIQRVDDVGGQGSYVIVVSLVGGTVNYDSLQLGNIATFVGAEGARITVPNAGPDSVTPCTGTLAAIGAFGGVCYDVGNFGLNANRPGTLAFFNMIDSGNSDSNYLWRVPAIPGDYNKMTVDLGMGLGAMASVTPNPDLLFNGNGSIAMDGGSITGVRGGILTGGGNIGTGGGTVDLGNSDLFNVNAVRFMPTNGFTPRISVGTDADSGQTTLNFNNTDVRVFGTLRASNLLADSFIYTSSDIRLKDNIRDLAKPLDTLLQVRGVSYRLKSANQQTDGVLAQDVEKVYPELVKTDENGYKKVNYNGLIGPLIESIRELKQRNDALQARVDALEAGQRN